jgi:membrane protein YdbS with pleckstrin-like domain
MDRTVTPPPEPYQPSLRRTAGALLILLLIGLWAALVVQFAGIVGRWPMPAQAVFYVVAGIAWIWILPLRRILVWSETGRWRG